jgi:hypothetical protein
MSVFEVGHAAKSSAQEARRTSYNTHAHPRDMQQQKAAVSLVDTF